MTEILLVGLFISAIIGLMHGVYVYQVEMAEAGSGRAVYFGLWTFFLWLLLGSYALLFWVISVVVYAVYRAVGFLSGSPIRRRRSTRR